MEPNYVQACYLHGDVTDAATGAAIPGARAKILTTLTFEDTDAVGEFKTGIATSGTYDIEVSKPGYETEVVSAEMVNGEITTISVQLDPAIPFNLTGNVVAAGTNTPIANANIKITNGFFDYDLNADADGNFTLNGIFPGNYDVVSAEWGYLTYGVSNELNENNSNITIELQKGYEDVFCFDLGWTVSGVSDTGPWERGLPIGVDGGGVNITPSQDTDDFGPDCYVTGNIDDLYGGVLTGGTTTLTSPVFDLTDYVGPMLSYNYWFLNFNLNTYGFGPDKLLVELSNGTDTVTVAEYENAAGFNFGWFESDEFDILDLIDPTDNMTFWITASASNGPIITEAGLDHFQVWDANPVSVNNPTDEDYQMSIYPNPSSSEFTMNYSLTNKEPGADLVVYNMLGQMVESLPLSQNNNAVQFGEAFPKGFYFVQIKQQDGGSKVLKIIKE